MVSDPVDFFLVKMPTTIFRTETPAKSPWQSFFNDWHEIFWDAVMSDDFSKFWVVNTIKGFGKVIKVHSLLCFTIAEE